MTAAPILPSGGEDADAKDRRPTRNQVQHAEYIVVDFDPGRAARMRFAPVLDLCTDQDRSVDDSKVVGCRVVGLADKEDRPKTAGAVLVGDVVAAIDGRNVLACDFGDVVSRLVTPPPPGGGSQATTTTTTTRSVTLRRGTAGDDGTDLVEQQARNRIDGNRWRRQRESSASTIEGTAAPRAQAVVSSSSVTAGSPPLRRGSTRNAQSSAGVDVKRCPPRRRCSVDGCTNQVVRDGVCISHGAKRKTCSAPGCDKRVKRFGLCSAHGPSRKRCEAFGCTKVAVRGGRCVSHGAKKRMCSVGGCEKWGIVKGMCRRHHQVAQRREREREREQEQMRPQTTSTGGLNGTFHADFTVTSDEITSKMMGPHMGVDPPGVVGPETGHHGTCHFLAGEGEGETDPQEPPLHTDSNFASEKEHCERIGHYKTPSVKVVHQQECQRNSLHHGESAALKRHGSPMRTATSGDVGATIQSSDDRDEFVEMLEFLDDFEVEGGCEAHCVPSPGRSQLPAPALKKGVDYASECTMPKRESSRLGGDVVTGSGRDGRTLDDEFVVGDLDFITRGTSFATEYGITTKTCKLCGVFCTCSDLKEKDNLSGGMPHGLLKTNSFPFRRQESEIMPLENVAGFGRRSKQLLFHTRLCANDQIGADRQYDLFKECDGNMLPRPRSSTIHSVTCTRKRFLSMVEEAPQEDEPVKRGRQAKAAISSPFAPEDAPEGGPSPPASPDMNRSPTKDCIICGKNEDMPMCHFVGDGACPDVDGGAEMTKWSSRDVSVHAYCGVIAKLGPNAMPEYEVWSVDAIEKNFGRFPGFLGAMTRTRQAQASTDTTKGDEWYCLLSEFHHNLQHTFVANEDDCRPDSPQMITKPSEGVSSASDYSPRTVTKICVETAAEASSESPTTVIDPSDGIWEN